MKHNIRQRVINQYGLPVVKVETVHGELGSDLLDCNGKEIFEGDIVKYIGNETIFKVGETSVVEFDEAGLFAFNFGLGRFDSDDLEIVGHADD